MTDTDNTAKSSPSRCLVRGSINIDEFFHVPSIVRPGQTLSSTFFERRAGGKGANQAVAVARAGGSVTLVGAVGTDGAWVVSGLRDAGVCVSDIVRSEEEPTGRAIIQLTPEGENSIILHRGANYASSPTLTAPAPNLQYTHLLLQNEIPFAASLSFLEHAQKIRAVTCLNPSPLPSASELRQIPWEQVDWLIMNEGETEDILHALRGAVPGSSVSPKAPQDAEGDKVSHAGSQLRVLHGLGAFSAHTNLVCTLGARGVVALIPALEAAGDGDAVLYTPAARLQGNVVDTTGAGDCFTGYLIAGLMEHRVSSSGKVEREGFMQILRRATEAAGLCVQRAGAMGSIPSKAEVDICLGV